MCQKKNHFQVTVHIGVSAEPHYVQTPSGLQTVGYFQIKVFGIKVGGNKNSPAFEMMIPGFDALSLTELSFSLKHRAMR